MPEPMPNDVDGRSVAANANSANSAAPTMSKTC